MLFLPLEEDFCPKNLEIPETKRDVPKHFEQAQHRYKSGKTPKILKKSSLQAKKGMAVGEKRQAKNGILRTSTLLWGIRKRK